MQKFEISSGLFPADLIYLHNGCTPNGQQKKPPSSPRVLLFNDVNNQIHCLWQSHTKQWSCRPFWGETPEDILRQDGGCRQNGPTLHNASRYQCFGVAKGPFLAEVSGRGPGWRVETGNKIWKLNLLSRVQHFENVMNEAIFRHFGCRCSVFGSKTNLKEHSYPDRLWPFKTLAQHASVPVEPGEVF